MLDIILAIEDDDDRMFVEKIYNDYSEKMYEIAKDILKHHFDAQDAVHDTVTLIIDKLNKYRDVCEGEPLRKMVCITCRNIAFKRYRKKKVANEYEFSLTLEEDGEIIDIPDLESNIEKLVISEESCREIYGKIEKLDLKYRDVISLRLMGMDNEDISQIMGISPELVRQRTLRARQKLLEK